MEGLSDTYARLMQDQQSKSNLNSRPTNHSTRDIMPNGPSFTAAVASLHCSCCVVNRPRLASVPQLLPSHLPFPGRGYYSLPDPDRFSTCSSIFSIFNRHPRRNDHRIQQFSRPIGLIECGFSLVPLRLWSSPLLPIDD